MEKLIVILLVLVSALVAQAAVLPSSSIKRDTYERKGFRLLGSMKKPKIVTHSGITSKTLEDWDYWDSGNLAGWAEARRDCEANGDNLLYLETTRELQNVSRWLLDRDDSGGSFWIGGKYDVRSTSFIWNNGVPLSPEAPWGSGQPRDMKPNSRVAVSTTTGEVKFKTQAATVVYRYICEGQRADDVE